MLARIQELTDYLLHRGTVPVLLATPTEASGAIDPAVFEERMATYRDTGIKPLPLDLEQAELRVERGHAHRPELDTLTLAEIFAPGEIPDLSLEALGMPWGAPASPRGPRFPRLSLSGAKPGISAILHPELMREGKLRFPAPSTPWGQSGQLEYWPILLPHEPDELAVHAMTTLYDQAAGNPSARSTIFPQLAETAGTPGPLTHLALAYALGADRPEHRIAAQDALLILAARGLLLPELIGGLGGVLWRRDMIKGKRFLDSLSAVEQSGATAEVFAITTAAVGVLVKYPHLRGLPDLLLLASRCAVSGGIREVDVPGLAEFSALAKPKRVADEARRLQQALVGPIASVAAV